MARSSWVVNAPGPTVQKRSRGRSCWRCSERRRAIQPTYCGSLADWYRNNATRLRRSAVALLELLAAPAGAWIVAADAGIGIRRKRRFGHSTALPALHRRRGRPGRGGGQPAGGTGGAAGGRARTALTAGRGGGAYLDLQLEPALGERRLQVVHQPDEHVVRFFFVLDQRVLLTPRAVVDAFAQLVEVVQMIAPLVVDDGDRDLRQRLLAQFGRADFAFDVLEVVELGLERRATGGLRRAQQLVTTSDLRRIGEVRNGDHEFLHQLRFNQRAVPLSGVIILGEQAVDLMLDRGVDHPLRFGLQLFAAFERVQPLRVDHFPLLVHDVVELQQPFALLEVLELDAFLRLADRGRHPRMGDDLPLFGAGAIHDARDPVGAEQAHQVVLE